MIQIQNQPITFPQDATWWPHACALAPFENGQSLQDSVTGKFLSVLPQGVYEWIDAPRGAYECFTLADGFVNVAYVAGDDRVPVSFRIPFRYA